MRSGLGQTKCQELHERYAVSLRTYEQAVREIESCKESHASYQAGVAAHERALANRDACAVATARYQAARREADVCTAQHTAWAGVAQVYTRAQEEFAAEQRRIQALNLRIAGLNRDAQLAWEREAQAVASQNAALRARHVAAVASHAARMTAYQNYLAAVRSLRDRTQAEWDRTRTTLYNGFLDNYGGYPVSVMCNGTGFPCVSEANKSRWTTECTVIRGVGFFGGLGATAKPASTKCHWRYMPTCPTCPPAVANPGASPVEPTYAPTPARPEMRPSLPAPTWEQWISRYPGTIRDPGPRPTCSPNPPGSASPPSCDPNAPAPLAPTAPTCTVPTTWAPSRPVPPACDPEAGLFSGTGAMWLVALGVGGSLYYLAKKK